MSTPIVWKTKLAPEDVRPGDCKARRLDDIHRLPTTPYIHLESQCIQTPHAGGDLCHLCKGRWDAYAALPPTAETNLKKATRWRGRVTEPAMDWVHVMGTRWAEPVIKRWREEQALEAKKAAEKAAAKAAKEAQKAAEKAAKKPAGGAGGPSPAAPAPPPEEEVIEGDLKLIDGTLYIVKSGNVYEFDEETEKMGEFVGRLKADGESIDTEAEEQGEEVVVLEAPAVTNAVKETANATPAVEHPSFEDLMGHLGMVERIMDSTRSAAYKLVRLTEFLTVCSKFDYAPFWRTDFDSRHRMRTNLIMWKEFGICAAADTFLGLFPA